MKPAQRLLAALAVCLAVPTVHAQSFQGLGFLDTGERNARSEALDVSADGSVVVGVARKTIPNRGDGYEFAFRWSSGRMDVLQPAYSQYPYGSTAFGVSADGSIAVGWSSSPLLGQSFAATRWSGTSGTDIGPGSYAQGRATSDDGSVIVGVVASASVQTLRSVNGSPQTVTIGSESTANDVSANGAVMVGYTLNPAFRAYRWENDTVEFLPGLPGQENASHAYGISPDASIIVGWASRAGKSRMVRWVNRAIQDLGANGIARGTSANGQVIVGDTDGDVNGDSSDAFGDRTRARVWTPARGVEDLRTYLVDVLGLDLTGWTLVSATSVSADGNTVVGYGRNPSGKIEAWRARFRGGNDIVVNKDGDQADASNTDSSCDVDLNEAGLQCTLRAALQVANAKPGSRIIFDIPGAALPRIALQSALPAVTARVTIDGTTQAGRLVEVRGGVGFDGLRLSGGNSTIKGLVLNNFTRTGATGGGAIVLSGAGGNTITGNYIGTDVAGNAAVANRSGIIIDGSPDNTIGGAGADANIISGNETGVQMRRSVGNRVLGNRIGLGVDGGFVRNNMGVYIGESSTNVVIGGTQPNRIASRDYDVIIATVTDAISDIEISGNFLGLNASGTNAGNPTDAYTGIAVNSGRTATAITAVKVLNNHIAGPHLAIWLVGSGVREARVADNQIGLAFNNSGTLPAGLNANVASSTGLRTEAAYKTLVENNIIVGQGWGILATGSLQSEESTVDGASKYQLYGPDFPLSNDPGTGNEVRITGNKVGLNALNAKPAGVSPSRGITVYGGADRITIDNNIVAGFAQADISLTESSNLTVSGNRIGTADGTNHGSGLGVWIDEVDTATIGGPGIEGRNIISRHTDAGILIEGDSRNILVLNNNIGTDIAGAVAWGNGTGIRVDADDDGIPSLAIRNNLIGGSTGIGIDIDNAVRTQVANNLIGVSSNGVAIPNGMGLSLRTSPAEVSGNVIAYNTGPALAIKQAAVTIAGNSIYENEGGIVYESAPFAAPAGVLVMRSNPTDQEKIGVFVAVAATGAPTEVTLEIFGNRNCTNPQGRVLLLKRTVAGNKPLLEFFSTESWNALGTLNGFTVTATRGALTSSFSGCSEAQPFADSDDDGAMDLFEFIGGDRNGDGIADSGQRNVATHVSIAAGGAAQMVTLVSAPGTSLQQSSVVTSGLPPIEGVTYTLGLALFDIQGLSSGTQTTVDMILESGRPADELKYIKLRSLADKEMRVMPDSGSGDRAERTATGWRLYLTDGGAWDVDGVANGRIRDPGGPVKVAGATSGGKRGGGGSVDLALCLLLGVLLGFKFVGPTIVDAWMRGCRSAKHAGARQNKSTTPPMDLPTPRLRLRSRPRV